uniref:Uncharacterized protein n=1 Tax=Acrobeloides nanus TaxID=290746 RepID=A0A914EGF5_9BILA
MGSLRQVAVFLSLAVFVAAFALAISGLTTDYWVDTEHVTRNNAMSALSFVHSGLFYGERQLDYGQEIKLEPFSVYDEIHKETSFMNRTLWILCIFFIALGILWVFVGLLISLMNSVKMNDETIIGPSGIYVWSILALLSFLAAIGIFVVQFFTSIMSNVLLPIHLNAGFSSTDQARLVNKEL